MVCINMLSLAIIITFLNTDEDTLPVDVLRPEFSGNVWEPYQQSPNDLLSLPRCVQWFRDFPKLDRSTDALVHCTFNIVPCQGVCGVHWTAGYASLREN